MFELFGIVKSLPPDDEKGFRCPKPKSPGCTSLLAANASCGTSRVGAEEAASLNAPTRGIPPDRAKTKAAGVGPGCCEGPPVEVSILFMCSGANTVARRQDPQNR